jgi:hypothetical protein
MCNSHVPDMSCIHHLNEISSEDRTKFTLGPNCLELIWVGSICDGAGIDQPDPMSIVSVKKSVGELRVSLHIGANEDESANHGRKLELFRGTGRQTCFDVSECLVQAYTSAVV